MREPEEGGFWARALGQSIFSQGETWEELRDRVKEAVGCHFVQAAEKPKVIPLHFVQDEAGGVKLPRDCRGPEAVIFFDGSHVFFDLGSTLDSGSLPIVQVTMMTKGFGVPSTWPWSAARQNV